MTTTGSETRSSATPALFDDAADSIASVLAEAFDYRDRDVAVSFGGLIDACLHVTAPGEEVWVAIATQAADGRFVEERLRDVLFGLVLAAVEAELWEPRADWPSGEDCARNMGSLGTSVPTRLIWMLDAQVQLRPRHGTMEAVRPT